MLPPIINLTLSAPLYLYERSIRVNIAQGNCYEIIGGNHGVDFDGYDRYDQHVMRIPNIGSGYSKSNFTDKKYQDNYEFIIINALSDSKGNWIHGTIKETDPKII